jgi:predicted acyl esterase
VLGGPIDATVYATSTTTNTELVATVEEVSPTGQSVPLTSGALLGSLRAETAGNSWIGGDGQALLPYHPYTKASAQPVVPGAVTRYDIEVFPTFAQVPAGWRIRVTVSTSDTPHLVPTLARLPGLVGGVYQVQRNAGAASFVNLPLAPASAFPTPCTEACPAG